MTVKHFLGMRAIESEEDLDAVLHVRNHDRMNAFELTHDSDEALPTLSLLVNWDDWVAYFFPTPSHPGHVSTSREDKSASTELLEFALTCPHDRVWIPKTRVISGQLAQEAAACFWVTRGMTPHLDWLEL